jgi:hypothetical protein
MLRVPLTNGALVDPNRLQSALADAKRVVSAAEPAVREMLPKVRSPPGFQLVGSWQLACSFNDLDVCSLPSGRSSSGAEKMVPKVRSLRF